MLIVSISFLQSENETLKREISVMRESIAAKKEQVRKEFLTHTQIKKDIEVWEREMVTLSTRATTNNYLFSSAMNLQITDMY